MAGSPSKKRTTSADKQTATAKASNRIPATRGGSKGKIIPSTAVDDGDEKALDIQDGPIIEGLQAFSLPPPSENPPSSKASSQNNASSRGPPSSPRKKAGVKYLNQLKPDEAIDMDDLERCTPPVLLRLKSDVIQMSGTPLPDKVGALFKKLDKIPVGFCPPELRVSRLSLVAATSF